MKRMIFAFASILFHAAAFLVTGVNAQNFEQQTNGGAFRSIQPSTPTSAIVFGETICSAISNPAETDAYTFSANAGDRIIARMSVTSGNLWAGLRVVGPSGNTLRQVNTIPTAEIDTLTVPIAGTYSILCYDGFNGTRTGNYCLFLQRLNNPGNVRTASFGQTLSDSITSAAQMDGFIFSANAGDRVLLRMTQTGGTMWSGLRIYTQNGSRLRVVESTPTVEMDTLNVPATGNYLVLCHDGFDGTRTGKYSAHWQRINNPSNAKAIAYGQTLSDTLTRAPETRAFTFFANSGDKIITRMSIAGGTMWSGVRVYNPSGRRVRVAASTPTVELDTLSLSVAGRYTILAHDGFDGTRTGNYSLFLQRVVNPANAVAVDYGQVRSGTISTSAKMDAFTFTGLAGKRVMIQMTVTSGSMWAGLRVYGPTGQKLRTVSSVPTVQIDTLTLPSNGQYTFMAYDGFNGTRSGGYNVSLLCLVADCRFSGCSYSISPTSASFGPSGGTGAVTVTATAGCSWSATSNASWLRITFGSSGTGNGVMQYIVDANPNTTLRTGVITFTGQNFLQAFTVTQSGTPGNRIVRVVSAGATPGASVSVPIELISLGNENALGFSLSFDPTILSNPQAARGSDATTATLLPNPNEAQSGRFGILLSLPAGQVFAVGTRQIGVMSFTVNGNTAATATTIAFGDQPIVREVVDVNASVLPATWTSGTVTITQGFEADVAPRPNGDNNVLIADCVQVGRFVAKLDPVRTDVNEFQRADCAPKDSLGNGKLSAADWTQACRYAARLDPLVRAGGPASPRSALLLNDPLAGAKVSAQTAAARTVRIINPEIQPGRPHAAIIELEAEGNENALGFSLGFDQTVLSNANAQNGVNANGASLIVNSAAAANGRLGFVLILPVGQTLSAGTHQILVVNFTVSSNAGVTSSPIVFSDDPVAREVVDANANVLPANWSTATSVQESMAEAPESFDLGQNYPNPFNPTTIIQYALPKSAQVKLAIYDLLGAKIRTLVEGVETTGLKQVTWDAKNDLGEPVPSGVYLYRLEAGEFIMTRRLVVMK